MILLQGQSPVSHITPSDLHSKLFFAVSAKVTAMEDLYLKGKKQQN